MGAELSPDFSQCLVAYAGEVITCPQCGAELATFLADAFGPPPWEYTDGEAALYLRERELICRCGGRPTMVSGADGDPIRGRAPQMHLSTGWRDLGGE